MFKGEAYALLLTIKWSVELGFDKVCFELDCTEVLDSNKHQRKMILTLVLLFLVAPSFFQNFSVEFVR